MFWGIENIDSLQASLGNQANIMMEKGNNRLREVYLFHSLLCYIGWINFGLALWINFELAKTKAKRLTGNSVKKRVLQFFLLIRYWSLNPEKNLLKALPRVKEAYEIAVSHGLAQLERKILPILLGFMRSITVTRKKFHGNSFILRGGYRILLKKSLRKPEIVSLSSKKGSVKIFHEWSG